MKKVQDKLQDIIQNSINLLFVIRQDNTISKNVAETLLEGYHDERWIIDIPVLSTAVLPQGTLSAAHSLLHVSSVSEATQTIVNILSMTFLGILCFDRMDLLAVIGRGTNLACTSCLMSTINNRFGEAVLSAKRHIDSLHNVITYKGYTVGFFVRDEPQKDDMDDIAKAFGIMAPEPDDWLTWGIWFTRSKPQVVMITSWWSFHEKVNQSYKMFLNPLNPKKKGRFSGFDDIFLYLCIEIKTPVV